MDWKWGESDVTKVTQTPTRDLKVYGQHIVTFELRNKIWVYDSYKENVHHMTWRSAVFHAMDNIYYTNFSLEI